MQPELRVNRAVVDDVGYIATTCRKLDTTRVLANAISMLVVGTFAGSQLGVDEVRRAAGAVDGVEAVGAAGADVAVLEDGEIF